MARLLCVIEANRDTYCVDVKHIAHSRASYFASREGQHVYDEEYHFALNDDLESKDWFLNNMEPDWLKWEDESGKPVAKIPNMRFGYDIEFRRR
jgi:hypothetical protein